MTSPGSAPTATGDSSNGQVVAYLLRPNGHVSVLSVPGSSSAQALGVNDNDEVVGFYTDSAGNTDGPLANPAHRHRD